ncbi:MAG: hypothetical protein N2445_05300, partial [Acidobacteria bacterium]|nr:hypothetical protein [Acidobacteriota bacterium]
MRISLLLKKHNLFLVTSLLIFLAFSSTIGAHFVDPKSKRVFSHWTTEEGLPQNSITSIAKSKDGYLILGTLGGLVKFDGVDFTPYISNKEGEYFKGSRITTLFFDSKNRLWVGTQDAGVVLIEDGRARNLSSSANFAPTFVTSFTEMDGGLICAGTDLGVIFIKDSNIVKIVSDNLPSLFVSSLLKTNKGDLFIGTTKGLAVYRNGTISKIP